VALSQEDIAFIKTHMAEWLTEQSLGKPAAVYEIELRERMVRVEEELKHQRELMREGFAQVERRLEQIDKRFEQVDKRFEQVDKRFEQVDKRFEQVDKRFDQVDKRLEQLDRRFEQVDSRFDEMIRRHDRHFLWLIGFITSVGALIIAAGKFW
jgi:septal ring factor EnvC (AmiA/AmiB activator)